MVCPPSDLQERLGQALGCHPATFEPVDGGYTPAARWRFVCGGAKLFAKVATNESTATALRREAHAYRQIRGSFIPALVAWSDHVTHPILVLEDLSAAQWPPPWRNWEVEAVLSAVETMHTSNCDMPAYAEVHAARGDNWAEVALDPRPFLNLGLVSRAWLDRALPMLLQAESECATEGTALTHWDLRSDNLCLVQGSPKFIDWPGACRSNPALDTGFWLPSLAYEGGPDPSTILPGRPDVAAWVSGFFAARAGLPFIPDAPRVRQVQREQLQTALRWVANEVGLPEPPAQRA